MSDFDLPLPIVLGVGLAAATGFRVFLPLLIVSGAAYSGHLPLADNFAWLGTSSALIMLGVAAFVEVLAYYVPGVDNLLDTFSHASGSGRGNRRVSGGHDSRPADGEMDGGRHRGRRCRWPHARRGPHYSGPNPPC